MVRELYLNKAVILKTIISLNYITQIYIWISMAQSSIVLSMEPLYSLRSF